LDCKWIKGAVEEPGVLPEGAALEWQAYAVLKLSCKSIGADASNLNLSLIGPEECSSSSSGVCVEKNTIPTSLTVKSSDYTDLGYVLYKNANVTSSDGMTLSKGTAGVSVTQGDSKDKVDVTGDKFVGEDLRFHAYGEGLSCDVNVSGVINDAQLVAAQCNNSSSCTPSGTVDVKNGTLIFAAQLKSSSNAFISSGLSTSKVTWQGGPDSTGTWSSMPPNQAQLVRATLLPPASAATPKYCSISAKQQAVAGIVKLNPLGDCLFFQALRSYYFLNPSGTAEQTSGYSGGGISLPGIDQAYGTSKPEVPVQGILNVATKTDGHFNIVGDQLVVPNPADRMYTSTVVTASPFDPASSKIGDPVAYGIVDLGDYKTIQMVGIGSRLNDLNPDSLIVLQSFVAHSQVSGGVDKRGAGGVNLYSFTPSMADKIVPFVNDACLPNFQFSMPTRPDKTKLPDVLRSATLCGYSRPEKVADLRSGRLSETVLSLAPLNAAHRFPTGLVATSPVDPQASSSVGTAVPSSGGACWVINPSSLGGADWEDQNYQGAAATHAITITDDNECSTVYGSVQDGGKGGLGFRRSMVAMVFGINLGCAVTLDKSGTPVYGDIDWDQGYDTHEGVAGSYKLPDPSKPHFGSVNCYEGTPSFSNEIAQWAYSSGAPNSFTKSSATSGIRTQTFYIRNWGGNYGKKVDDAFGSFDVPLCPGSQFKYDTVSLSWSPLVLDLKGNGIKISRTFKRSVGFHLHNKKYLSYVDWPENVEDVAFLIRPTYKGGVISLKDLYGDTDALNGFEQLRKHDSNKDGVITKADKDYSKLRLWFDRNRNGLVDKGELESITKYSVDKIYMAYTKPLKGFGAEQRSLQSTYWNAKLGKFFNIEDMYVNEYNDKTRLLVENKKK